MSKLLTVEVFIDKVGKYRWRVFAANKNQLAKSPKGYQDKTALVDALSVILSKNHDADLFKDKAGEWRWRFCWDGVIIAIASEGYKNKSDCKRASDSFLDAQLA